MSGGSSELASRSPPSAEPRRRLRRRRRPRLPPVPSSSVIAGGLRRPPPPGRRRGRGGVAVPGIGPVLGLPSFAPRPGPAAAGAGTLGLGRTLPPFAASAVPPAGLAILGLGLGGCPLVGVLVATPAPAPARPPPRRRPGPCPRHRRRVRHRDRSRPPPGSAPAPSRRAYGPASGPPPRGRGRSPGRGRLDTRARRGGWNTTCGGWNTAAGTRPRSNSPAPLPPAAWSWILCRTARSRAFGQSPVRLPGARYAAFRSVAAVRDVPARHTGTLCKRRFRADRTGGPELARLSRKLGSTGPRKSLSSWVRPPGHRPCHRQFRRTVVPASRACGP